MRTLLLMAGGQEFFTGLWAKYALDLQDFLHEKLERLVGVALLCWLLMWLLGLISRHILRLAERQATTTAGHYAQVRTLMSVMRATGIGVILVLATLQVLSVFGFNLARCSPAPAWPAWRSGWPRRTSSGTVSTGF